MRTEAANVGHGHEERLSHEHELDTAHPLDSYLLEFEASSHDLYSEYPLPPPPEARLAASPSAESYIADPYGWERNDDAPVFASDVQRDGAPHATDPIPEPPLSNGEDFWHDVVALHHWFAQHPELRKTALPSAIAWAAAGLSAHEVSSLMGRSNLVTGAAPGALDPRGGALPESALDSPVRAWLDDVSERATRALVVAAQQRDSALRAAGGGRG